MERQIVEQELEKLVEIAKTEVPILSEIRVFGSYNNKNWDPEKSDIDVLLEVGVSGYSVLSLEYQRDTPDCIVQDKRARKITMEIRRLINGKFSDRFSFFVLTEDDVKLCLGNNPYGRGDFGKDMKEGRLLYQSR